MVEVADAVASGRIGSVDAPLALGVVDGVGIFWTDVFFLHYFHASRYFQGSYFLLATESGTFCIIPHDCMSF